METAIAAWWQARGWRQDRIGPLPMVYCRSSKVTPYYEPLLAANEAGAWSISGAIGVLDRDFETAWQTRQPPGDRYAFNMLSVNVLELIGGFVHPNYIVPDLGTYLALIEGVLNRLPADKAALKTACRAGEMLGIAMDDWGLMVQDGETIVSQKSRVFRHVLLES